MAEWRFGRGWSEAELRARVDDAKRLGGYPSEEPRHWRRYHTETVLAVESPGPPEPGGPFERACAAVERYTFSDPAIVRPHFDPTTPLEERHVLLELKVRGFGLRYLTPVSVGAVREERGEERSCFGYRVDTLPGHLERGSEWFLVEKRHASGEVRFRIEAWWHAGDFPNAWSRVGFTFLAPVYQRLWHRRSQARLARLVRGEPDGGDAWAGAGGRLGTGLDDAERAL